MTQHPANSALLVMDVQRTIVDRFPAPEYLPGWPAPSRPPAPPGSR